MHNKLISDFRSLQPIMNYVHLYLGIFHLHLQVLLRVCVLEMQLYTYVIKNGFAVHFIR